MDFSQFKKPWNKSLCKARYCNGDRISLTALAQDSGVSFDRLKNWSTAENWVLERKRFELTLHSQIEAQVSKNLRDSLSSEISEILIDHWKSAKRGRTLIDTRLEAELAEVERIQDAIQTGEATESDLLEHIRSISPRDQSHLATALQKLLQSERESLGLIDFHNIDLLVQLLERQGYRIVEESAFEAMITDSEPDQLPQADITD